MASRSAISPGAVAVVAVGGALGASARWAVLEASGPAGTFPWWTLLVNVAGCLGLGLLLGADERLRLGLGVGFCGGLTTFSTFTVEVATLLDAGDATRALAYLVLSVAGGLSAVLVGFRLAARRR